MSDLKKPPVALSDALEWDVVTEISFDEFMHPKLKLIQKVGDTAEDRVQAQVEFLRATSTASAGAGGQTGSVTPTTKDASPRLSELVDDYKRDRLAANKWRPKTQDENLAVYKLCIDIIGNLPLSEIGEDQALPHVDTLKKLSASINKMPAYRGKTINELSR